MSPCRESMLRAAAATIALFSACSATGLGQQPRQYTAEDYANAEKFMSYNVNPLVYKGIVHAQWIDGERFWYRDADSTGVSYTVVDAAKGTRAPAFDQVKLAAALNAASNGAIKDNARHLSLSELSLTEADSVAAFSYSGVPYRCDLQASSYVCKSLIPIDAQK